MRLAFVLPLAALLAACTNPAPKVPAEAEGSPALDMPLDRASYSKPVPAATEKRWCYEVGDAPAHIKPRCESSPETCEAALGLARQGGVADGFGNPFSECRPLRSDDFTRPHRLSGKAPVVSSEAREAGLKDAMIVQCTLTTSGILDDCRIIRSIPLMDQAVLTALSTWRFEPSRFVGRPVSIKYTIPFRFALP
jgi:TonB family protein